MASSGPGGGETIAAMRPISDGCSESLDLPPHVAENLLYDDAHHEHFRIKIHDLVKTNNPAIMSVMGDALNHIFQELKSRNKETRLRGSYELLNHVNIAHRGELS